MRSRWARRIKTLFRAFLGTGGIGSAEGAAPHFLRSAGVRIREGYLFFKKRYPSLIIEPLRGAGNKCSAVALPYYFFYSALGSFAAGFISNAQMTIARIVFGSI